MILQYIKVLKEPVRNIKRRINAQLKLYHINMHEVNHFHFVFVLFHQTWSCIKCPHLLLHYCEMCINLNAFHWHTFWLTRDCVAVSKRYRDIQCLSCVKHVYNIISHSDKIAEKTVSSCYLICTLANKRMLFTKFSRW